MTRIVSSGLMLPLALAAGPLMPASSALASGPPAQAGATATSDSGTPVDSPKSTASPGGETPQALYQAGKAAYRLSHYADAVDKWERSYAASGKALLLYNIGLAYREWYSVSLDENHLRKAKAVFQNYAREAARRPEMDQADAQNQASAQIVEIDAKLAELEAKAAREAEQARRDSAPAPTPEAAPAPAPVGEDPGRKFRRAGIGALAGGGAAVLTGVVLGVVFGVKGREFSSELDRIYDEQGDADCDEGGATSSACLTLAEAERVTRDNGHRANTLTVLSFAAIGGVGVAALTAGAVLYVHGNKRTAGWRRGVALHVAPTLGGAVLSGRF